MVAGSQLHWLASGTWNMPCQLYHRAFAHPVPLPGMPFLQVSSWLSPHFPQAAHLTREDIPENPIWNIAPLPPSPCFVFQHGTYYSLKWAVWLSDFSHWNISSPRVESFILFTAGDPEFSSILTHSGYSVNTEWMNIEWARTAWCFNFAHEHGRKSHFCKPTSLWELQVPQSQGQFAPWTKRLRWMGSSFHCGLHDYFE